MSIERTYELILKQRRTGLTDTELAELTELKQADSTMESVEQLLLSDDLAMIRLTDSEVDNQWAVLKKELTPVVEVVPTTSSRTWRWLIPLLLLLGAGAAWYFLSPEEEVINTEHIKTTVLPDDTKVTVGRVSSISYLSGYNETHRDIIANGELYIEATKSDIPLVIKTKHLRVEVLGTRFSIMDHPNQVACTITLYDGRLQATLQEGSKTVDMVAGDHLYYNRQDQTFVLEKTNDKKPTWLSGKLAFDNTLLPEALARIAIKYNVVITVDPAGATLHYTDSVMEEESVDEVLSRVAKSSGLRVVKNSESHYHLAK